MKKKELLQKKITELRGIAKELGLSIPRTATKEEIAAFIIKTLKLKELRSKERIKKAQEKVKKPSARRKGAIRAVHELPLQEIRPVSVKEEIYPAVPSLKITKDLVGLVPVDHQNFYLYWQISKETSRYLREAYKISKFTIRIYELVGGRDISSAPYFDIQIPKEDGGFHINIGKEGEFVAELGVLIPDERFIPFLRSNIIIIAGIKKEGILSEVINVSFPSGIVHPTSF